MKFMMIVKHKEGQGFPPKELMEAIANKAAEAAKVGTMLGSGGLLPTAAGARVRLSGGKISVLDGPFTEAKEVVGGYAAGLFTYIPYTRRRCQCFVGGVRTSRP